MSRQMVRVALFALVGLLVAGCAGPAAGPDTGPPSAQASNSTAANRPGGDHDCSPAVRLDWFTDSLDKTVFAGKYVGNLSGLAVDTDGSILALSDRSALFTLDPATLRPTRVVPLADERGQPLDSEAVAVDSDGTRLITSETGPSVRRYSRDGQLLGQLPVPDAMRVAPVGRAHVNATFEGLALAPDGHTLIASMESPLAGDAGQLVRLPTWTRAGGEFHLAAEYAYPVDPLLGVAELAAIGDGRLLVLERGYLPGIGNSIRLYLADLAGASDVRAVTTLRIPDVRPVSKTLLADLSRCPSLGATSRQRQANPLLDNIEGMTLTGRDPSGAVRMLLISDDNESHRQITRLYSLTVRPPTG